MMTTKTGFFLLLTPLLLLVPGSAVRAAGSYVLTVRASGDAAAATALREALAYWIDLADDIVAKPVSFGGFEMGALDDSGGAVSDLLKG